MANIDGAAPVRGSFGMDGISVRGIVSAVPATAVPNAFFEKTFSAAEIQETAKLIGVETRHWASAGQTTADLCAAAAVRLMAGLNWDHDSIDALIFVSQTPDHPLPATACILQHRLGLSKHTAAFDVGLGCSGYVYGLWLASALIGIGCRRVLLLAGDTSSRFLDHSDSGTALVFGDAGTATAIESDSSASQILFKMGSDGEGARHLMIPNGWRSTAAQGPCASDYLFMDGFQVFSFTLNAVPPLIKALLAEAGQTIEDVDVFLFHQANAFMLRHIAKKLKIPTEKFPMNMDRFGNTSSASIPLLVSSELGDIVNAASTRVVLAGFGAGYSWGACLMDLASVTCAETIFV